MSRVILFLLSACLLATVDSQENSTENAPAERTKLNVTFSCDENAVEVSVVNITAETLVYAADEPDTADCKFNYDSDDSAFVKTFSYTSNECSQSQSWTKSADGYTFEVRVYIQNHKDLLTAADERHTIKCQFPASALATLVMFNYATVDGETGFKTETQESTVDLLSLLQYSLTDRDGSELVEGARVTMGDPLTININLKTNNAFSGLSVYDCLVANKALTEAADPSFKAVMFIGSDKCPVASSNGLVETAQNYPTNDTYRLTISAFVFKADNNNRTSDMHIVCAVAVCRNTSEAPCSDTCSGVKRRRRSTEVSGKTKMFVGGWVQVTLPKNPDTSNAIINTDASGADAGCFMQQAILVALGLFLVLATVAIVALAFVLCRNKIRRQAKADECSMAASPKPSRHPAVWTRSASSKNAQDLFL